MASTPKLAPRNELASPHSDSSRLSQRDWAPLRHRPGPSPLSHLPTIPASPPPSFRTSHPHPSPLQSSITSSIARLVSLPAFAALLASPEGTAAFSTYLTAFHSPLAPSLQLYTDLSTLRRLSSTAAAGARGVRDAYLVPTSGGGVELEGKELREAVEGLRRVMEGGAALEGTSRRLLERLYEGEFEGYVKHRLLAHTKAQLEKRDVQLQDVAGLGEAFVLSNPRLPDQPIVLASPAFCALTGYDRREIVGRNCRFLQGPATNPSDVAAIRTAIKTHEPITQLLLNYTKGGAAFFNLLCILPLFTADGELAYFVGGQTAITGALTASAGLVLPPVPNSGADEEDDEGEDDELAQHFSALSTAADPSSLSAFSPAVQRAAAAPAPSPSLRSATSPPPDSTPSAFSTPALPQSPTFPSSAKARPSSLLASPALASLFKFGNFDAGASAPPAGGGAKAAAPLGVAQGSVEKRVEEFATTYEKVAVFTTEDRRIVHTTPSFLRYLGLPASPASPLVDVDLLDLLRGASDGAAETDAVRRQVKAAVAEGRSARVECGIRVDGKGAKGASTPTARGVLHLSPMQDYEGKAVAYVAIFA
ncbi:hypothetical protein JCM10207_006558 [Rhodosporidiobolus poonsookiae]